MVLIYISFVNENVCSWLCSSLAVFCFAGVNQNMVLLTGSSMVCGQYYLCLARMRLYLMHYRFEHGIKMD
jgi:hypothetical protein